MSQKSVKRIYEEYNIKNIEERQLHNDIINGKKPLFMKAIPNIERD